MVVEKHIQQGNVPAGRYALYTRVLAYIRPYRGQFVAALLCMVIFGASDGVMPVLVKKILDGVFTDRDSSLLWVLPAVIVAFATVRALAEFGQQFLMGRIGHYIVRDMRNQVNRQLLKLSPDYFIRHESGDLIARLTSDVLLIRAFLTDSAAAVIRDTIRIVALLVTALYLDPFLALIAFVLFPIGIFPVYKFGRRMRRLSKTGQDAIGQISSMLQESILGNRVVKIFAREEFEAQRFERKNRELTDTFVRTEKVRALSGPVNEVLASFAISGVILYGGYSVIGGVRSQGDFIAFLLAVFLLYDPFKKLSRVHATVQQGMSGVERLVEVLDAVPSVAEPEAPLPAPKANSISFKDVWFAYENERHVLKRVDLEIQETECVAIVGFSGAGKTTLVDLLPRFMDPQRGSISIGGVDISRLSLVELRRRIAMVGQHTFLFNDTIYNNILYGRLEASREEVLEAARAANAWDFIQRCPLGLDTIIGEGGFSISGGERQRLAIARAILKDAPILILDEATASLDNRAEREIQTALELLERDRTTLVIAHRLSTVRNADKIVVFRAGEIVEAGGHEELLNRGGEYAQLYALQFSASEEKASETRDQIASV